MYISCELISYECRNNKRIPQLIIISVPLNYLAPIPRPPQSDSSQPGFHEVVTHFYGQFLDPKSCTV